MKHIFGHIHLDQSTDDNFFVEVNGGKVITLSNLTVAYIGKLYLLNNDLLEPIQFIDIEDIVNLYNKYGCNFTEFLGGLYIIVIYDSILKKLFIFQNPDSYMLPLYYSISDNIFYFSSSLKSILRNISFKPNLNHKKLDSFLYNGFIVGNETLVEKIYKLTPLSFLSLNLSNKKIEHIKMRIPKREVPPNLARKNYYDILKNVTESELIHNQELNMCLSKGFDSNILLHIIKEISGKKVNTFSIGGVRGYDETKDAQIICGFYDDIDFNNSLVTPNTFAEFPNIVWLLEGAVYESGIFLQYELANLLTKNGISSIICGECADQFLSINYNNSYY